MDGLTQEKLNAIERGLPPAHGCNGGSAFVVAGADGQTMQEVVVCPVCAAYLLLAEVKRLRKK